MKKSTIIITCFIVAVSAFTGAFSGYVKSRIIKKEKAENIAFPYMAEHISTENITVGYLAKEEGNNIAIYSKMKNGSLKLYEKYDILVSMLPKYDRELLEKGIEFDNLSDALMLIENYSG